MVAAAVPSADKAWRRRLYIPNYQVGEAAYYARISPQTVAQWQKAGSKPTLSVREKREALSYMQLIEVAVVAAMRSSGVRLNRIRSAREYVSKELESEFPFAEYRFKTDGKRLFMDYEQIEGKRGRGKLLRPDQHGQLAWDEVIGRRLREFEYERKGIVVRWRVAGLDSAVVIDPRIAFGAPIVKGVPTWAIQGRVRAGESEKDIADDFGLSEKEVIDALVFEKSRASAPAHQWAN